LAAFDFPEEATIAIRIQLGPMLPMLSEIVIQMLGESDTIIIGQNAPGEDLLAAARRAGAQLLVVQSQPGANEAVEQIFALRDLSILMISGDGRQGRLVRFAQEDVALDRASISGLMFRIAGHA
jgi:hypothetical protein